MALEEVNHQLMNVKERVENLAERFLGTNQCNDLQAFVNNHPLIMIIVFLTLIFSAVPIIFFLCFAVITALISVVCFLCIEGCLILFGGLLLAGIVSFVAILTTGMVLAFSVAFWIAQGFHSVFCSRTSSQVPVAATDEKQDADSSDT